MNTKVYIDPACNINYSSFYLLGLRELYGKKNVVFTSKPFKELKYPEHTNVMAFVIDNRKYVIDFADSNAIFYKDFLEWADWYGKINYKVDCLPEAYRLKIKRIGANFGIACYGTNKFEALAWCLLHYFQCYHRLKFPFASYLSSYLWVYKRKMTKKMPAPIGSKFIFMVSRYWKGQETVNHFRINFIRACQRLDKEGVISFKGGLVPDTKKHDCPADVLLHEEIPFDEYMKGIHQSLLVFNTPAYYNCHGWKLPEYMSQGKIILSTPFINELPVSMEHGKHIYYASSSEEALYKAVKEIVENIDLQKILSNGCVSYWNMYANPKSCIELFLRECN